MIYSNVRVGAMLAVLATVSANSFAGCYESTASPVSGPSGNATTIAECSSYCSTQDDDYSLSLFTTSENGTICACAVTSPASTALVSALNESDDPTCPPETTTATLLTSKWTFESCSYASSTTAQFASTANSSTSCLDTCSSYPFSYAFPTVSGWNCYCAMSGGGAGQAACSDNTFYAYSAVKEEVRRSRL